MSSPEIGGLADRYAAAFAAHLGEGGESGLGAAYALGREAVAGQYSVLDFADAHHRALTAALTAAPVGRQGEIVQAAAEFIRESLSAFEIAARGYHEVQEIARIEHEHVEQLRSLADASVAINSSLTAEEILQLTADAARAVLGARRASIAIMSAEPRRPPIGATSPELQESSDPNPSRLSVNLRAQGQGPRLARGRRPARARVLRPRRRDPHAARRARLGGDRQRPPVPARAHDRAHAPALPASGRAARVPGLAAAVRFNAAGEGVELGGDFYDLFRARDGGWAALIGDIQGKGPEAAAVTALARHTLRAAATYEHRPSGVLTLLHRALREQVSDGRFCTVAYAYMQVVPGHVRLELACGGHPLPFIVHGDGSVDEVGRLGTLLGSDADPLLADVVIELSDEDVLVLYTDGVTEVRRHRQEVFGTDQLVELLKGCGGLGPDEVAERVESAVMHASMGRLRDDMAVLALGPDPTTAVETVMLPDPPDTAAATNDTTKESDG